MQYSVAEAREAPGLPQFNTDFLVGGQTMPDPSAAEGRRLPAGTHRLDVIVNGRPHTTQDIVIQRTAPGEPPAACLPSRLVRSLPLREALRDALTEDARCVDLAVGVEGATVVVDAAELQLRVSLPHAALQPQPDGQVMPADRDQGITAGFVDYTFNQHAGRFGDSTYVGLVGGFNVGPWRLRHRAGWSRAAGVSQQGRSSASLQRDVAPWNARLALGQEATEGALFQSVPFLGVNLSSDEQMLPDSRRGYAPTIRGVAQGSALVTVRQNGTLIHEVSVAPGPFQIDDLHAAGFGGDLQVTVAEAGGLVQQFTVAHAAVPMALRQGASRFSVTAGQVDTRAGLRWPASSADDRYFAEGTLAHGLSNAVTLLGGAQFAEGYRAAAAGMALTTGIGAFGADVAVSRTLRRPGQWLGGSRVRLSYQRFVAGTGTHFGVTADHQSAGRLATLGDAAGSNALADTGSARNRLRWNISQKTGSRSQLYFDGTLSAGAGDHGARSDFQLGLQSGIGRVTYGVSLTRLRLRDGQQDTRASVTFSMPLGTARSVPYMVARTTRSASGVQQSVDVNGSLGDANAFSYGASLGGGALGDRADLSASWQGGHGSVRAGASSGGDGGSTYSLGATGSVLVHAGGLNYGSSSGGAFVLIHAAGAEGARVGGTSGLRIAANGFAVQSQLQPYRWNPVELDPAGLPWDVELLQTSRRFAPTAGSIVLAVFETRRERVMFIDAVNAQGNPLPFGAQVIDGHDAIVGAVGQGGVVQLRGAASEGTLSVIVEDQLLCRLSYHAPGKPDANGFFWARSTCLPPLPPP